MTFAGNTISVTGKGLASITLVHTPIKKWVIPSVQVATVYAKPYPLTLMVLPVKFFSLLYKLALD